jgi:hypothetical protein
MHIWAHDTIGCRYESGAGLTLPTTENDASLQIETGTFHDEDQETVTGQCTTMRGWYKASANVFTFANYALPYLGTSGQPQFLDTDTYSLANVAANDFACYWVYASLDDARPIYIIPTHAANDYGTIAAARAEAPPSLAGLNFNAELKLIYRFIYKGDGNFQESADYRLSSPVPSGGLTSITAGSVSFTPSGNIASSSVQAAIEELDSEKQATMTKASASDIVTGTDDSKYTTSKGIKDAEIIPIHIGTSAPADTSILWLDTDEVPGASLEKAAGSDITTGTDDAKYVTEKAIADAGGLGAGAGIWTALTGSYASTSTFTFTGTATSAKLVQFSLLTCTDSAGTTRRIGYVKSASESSGTVTVTVVTDSNLASGDKDFKVAYNRKVFDYMHMVSIPGECIADTSYSQGLWLLDLKADSYLLPVDAAVITAAAGTGAALTYNVYKDTTALFSSAPDLATNAVLVEQRPTTNTLSAGEDISLRIMSSAGATNKAADFQAKLYIIPQLIYTAF